MYIHTYTYKHLWLLLGTEAPVMTPNSVKFSFLFFLSHKHPTERLLSQLWVS